MKPKVIDLQPTLDKLHSRIICWLFKYAAGSNQYDSSSFILIHLKFFVFIIVFYVCFHEFSIQLIVVECGINVYCFHCMVQLRITVSMQQMMNWSEFLWPRYLPRRAIIKPSHAKPIHQYLSCLKGYLTPQFIFCCSETAKLLLLSLLL